MKYILTTLIIFVLLSTSNAQIIVGYNSPPAANCINNTAVGTLGWSNPNRVAVSDDSRASTTAGQQGVTNYIKTTNYNFSLPAPCPSCIVGGIEARIERRAPFQPDVAILNNWQALPLNGPYNFTVTPANPPAIMNRALIVVIGIENGPRPLLNGGPVNPPAANNDSRDVVSVTYGGVPMMQACEVTYSSLLSGTAFWARNEIWFLNDAGISAASGNQIVISNPGFSYEYVEFVSAVSFQNVDQLAPVFASRTDTVVGNVNPFALGNPAPMLPGSCAVTAVVNGNPGSYVFNSGGASGIPGVNFVEGTDVNGSAIPGYGSSTPTMMTGHAIVPDGVSGNVAPVYQFSATSNRQVISMICVQRARDFDNAVRLIKANNVVGNNLSNAFTYPKADAYMTYGGSSNLWGTTWSLSDVTNAGFGLALSARVQNRQVEIDHMQLRLHLFSTLPVELVDFTGERINQDIQLSWSTSSETNNDFFEIHRSTDAISYEMLRRVDGAGNSNNLISYLYDDMSAPQDKVSYYKIRQVDYDGNFKWYGPISVDPNNKEASLSLYPNPATTSITITNLETMDHFFIYDMNGSLVKNGKMVNNIIDIDDLQTGVYFISFGDNAERIKFIKF